MPLCGDAVGAVVTVSCDAAPATVVIVALVPLSPPLVAVTVVAVPATVCVFSVTVARPFASVLDVAAVKEPVPADFVHVTVWPAVATALPAASASCAVITTPAPAAGEAVAAVTRYCVAEPAIGVIDGVLPDKPPVVP